MAEIKVARRYAKSLLSLGAEQGVTDALFNDIQLLLNTIKASRALAAMLKNPIIHSYKKDLVLKSLFGDRMNKVTLAFMGLITRKSREYYLEDIAIAFQNLYNASKGIHSAKVISAVQLDDQLRKRLNDIVINETGGTVQMNEVVDSNIIGGFILRWDDKQIDSSVTKKLSDLRKEFAGNVSVK
ncbi:MAG TPA: ATP synthase F1 subunit delta [Bacteroidia bacterium]|nr:ATP synthase F1 subunit delta [Bacteroidia bacterium]